MSAVLMVTLTCDAPGCQRSISIESALHSFAREKARAAGWRTSGGTRSRWAKDFCPTHATDGEAGTDT